jgi:S1-C subfamily serine protease
MTRVLSITQVFLLIVLVAPLLLAADTPEPATVFERSADSVVLLMVEKAPGETSQGTGFVVRSDGVIATALHVVENAKAITVKLRSGELYDIAAVYNFDKRKDLALLRIPAIDLQPFEFGDFSEVRAGDPVIAITNPKGLEHSFSQGNVSSIRLEESLGAKVIQTTASLSPGSSGGPLLTSSGRAIGVVSYKILGGESLNFCLPISYVQGLLQEDRKLSLADFNAAVRKADTRIASDFAAMIRGSMEGEWYSVTSGVTYVVRDVDGVLYFELKPQPSGESSTRTYGKVQQQNEGWRGELTVEFTCQYVTSPGLRWQKTHTKFCKLPMGVEVSSVTPTKITGRAQGIPSGTSISSRDCKTCLEGLSLEWRELVLVRPE